MPLLLPPLPKQSQVSEKFTSGQISALRCHLKRQVFGSPSASIGFAKELLSAVYHLGACSFAQRGLLRLLGRN